MNDRLFVGPWRLALLLTLATLQSIQPANAAEADARPARAAAVVVSSAHAGDLAEVARSLPRGASMRIEATPLEGFADASGLDLVRFEAVAPGARFIVQTDNGPRDVKPELPVYLRGSVDGMRGSVAVVSVRASGEVRGIVSGADGTWMLARGAGGKGSLRSRRVDRQALAGVGGFSCEEVANPGPRRTAASASLSASPTSDSGTRSLRLPIAYTAQIAVELDFDFYQLFAPDHDAAVLYALDLMAFTGALGEAELGMNVQVPFVQLWTTESDPFSSAALSRLGQLRTRWNQAGSTSCGGADCTTLGRTTVILLSAAGEGGVAYVPGICDSYHSPTNGFSYAFAGSMDGDFDIDSPGAVWDVVATTHELGHNFGSPHTHCYDPPIDGCYGSEVGCYSGSTSLPSGCPGNGQGCGTLMGYCHLLGGGFGNVSLTYGAGHPYGDTADRVPQTMISRIAIESAAAPACLTAADGMVELGITRNGTGSGTVTSSPAGIDCGSACRTYFEADTVVTLTPTPGTFSSFTGWSGDADCSDGVVTASAATSCIATFDGSCGAGNEDCNDGSPCTNDSCPGDDHCENTGTPRAASACFENADTRLKIADSSDPERDQLQWQWRGGEAFAQVDLGDPTTTTDYALCIYDSTGGVTTIAASLSLPAGSPGWRDNTPDGWRLGARDGVAAGIHKLELRTGAAGRTRIKLRAGGPVLPLPGAFSAGKYFDQDLAVIVQLIAGDDRCWTSSFSPAGTSKNTASSFNASGN